MHGSLIIAGFKSYTSYTGIPEAIAKLLSVLIVTVSPY